MEAVEDKKCYAIGTGSLKATCATGSATTVAFYWTVAVFAMIFLTL